MMRSTDNYRSIKKKIDLKLYILMNLSTQHIMKNNINGSRKTPTTYTLDQQIVFHLVFELDSVN